MTARLPNYRTNTEKRIYHWLKLKGDFGEFDKAYLGLITLGKHDIYSLIVLTQSQRVPIISNKLGSDLLNVGESTIKAQYINKVHIRDL
jgi:hypothetical protein